MIALAWKFLKYFRLNYLNKIKYINTNLLLELYLILILISYHRFSKKKKIIISF